MAISSSAFGSLLLLFEEVSEGLGTQVGDLGGFFAVEERLIEDVV